MNMARLQTGLLYVCICTYSFVHYVYQTLGCGAYRYSRIAVIVVYEELDGLLVNCSSVDPKQFNRRGKL